MRTVSNGRNLLNRIRYLNRKVHFLPKSSVINNRRSKDHTLTLNIHFVNNAVNRTKRRNHTKSRTVTSGQNNILAILHTFRPIHSFLVLNI